MSVLFSKRDYTPLALTNLLQNLSLSETIQHWEGSGGLLI